MACDFLITGCRGQLGSDLMSLLALEHSVHGIDIEDCDVTDREAVLKAVVEAGPQVVLHTAAYAEVDECEANREQAMLVNAEGAGSVALACRDVGARMVYYSTDYVFDGKYDRPYTEDDPPNPVTVYGQSKLQGERAVQAVLDDPIIMRISWVYGRKGHNFVKTMIRLGLKQVAAREAGNDVTALKVVDDQVGNPCWTMDIARQTRVVLAGHLSGLLHATSEGETTWHGLARAVFGILAMDVLLQPCTSAEFVRAAQRPVRSTLDNTRLAAAGLNVMRNWKTALESFLHEEGKELIREC
ncbi:MAG: dTDP-4-dehydrorhamnose reductase [candidate division Zixibacteria bacterium]|nr:dTDP-4-dehydrorhamnose reductase [candidate division Zixibacteria bacterium]MDH3938055.1 dTDP-4-dehydrorhamnose reductase [candidate division Zixibacteria bacterium]MDH4035410.1 dTDP-4-dehydrorhamnose reductase [candidate division Zixibacteria bacterium]